MLDKQCPICKTPIDIMAEAPAVGWLDVVRIHSIKKVSSVLMYVVCILNYTQYYTVLVHTNIVRKYLIYTVHVYRLYTQGGTISPFKRIKGLFGALRLKEWWWPFSKERMDREPAPAVSSWVAKNSQQKQKHGFWQTTNLVVLRALLCFFDPALFDSVDLWTCWGGPRL